MTNVETTFYAIGIATTTLIAIGGIIVIVMLISEKFTEFKTERSERMESFKKQNLANIYNDRKELIKYRNEIDRLLAKIGE